MCARCDAAATTVVIEVAAIVAYLDLCERHLEELLDGARPVSAAAPRRPLISARGRRRADAPRGPG
jgi:hypothetical protein